VSANGTVFMFSGQGSQYFHMGRALYDDVDVFRTWMQRLDAAARPLVGASVIDALYDPARGKGDPFDRLLLSHPAIYMTEIALAKALIAGGVRPDAVLGVSLGSFAAAAIAGCIDIHDGLQLVVHQAQAIERCCAPGGMIAVMADPALYDEPFLRERSALAAVNFAGHFTLSADAAELVAIEAELKRRQVAHQRVPVAFAFHSASIDPACEPFEDGASLVPVAPARIPLACCESVSELRELPEDFFWRVVRRPMRFRETIQRLDAAAPRRFVDVGPAGTLATFLKYVLPASSASTVQPLLTPFGQDRRNLDAALAAAVA
jgi:acyl transferase domain-containing protein